MIVFSDKEIKALDNELFILRNKLALEAFKDKTKIDYYNKISDIHDKMIKAIESNAIKKYGQQR